MGLTAGSKLDDLVAEKVMGWKRNRSGPKDVLTGRPKKWDQLPFEYVGTPGFSTSIYAAWQVIERMGGDFDLTHFAEGDWQAQFDGPDRAYEALAETAPLAICLAALKAVDA